MVQQHPDGLRTADMQKPCSVCGGPAALEITYGDIDLYRCPSCDHCLTDHERLQADERYGPEYYELTHRNWFLHPNIKLFQLIWKSIESLKPDAAVLDVGCGKGDLLKYLHQKSPDLRLTGIDLSRNEPAMGIDFRCEDFMQWAANEQFDVVCSMASIEHMADVQAFAKRLYDVCAPGGVIIINTINERSILYATARLLRLLGITKPFERLYDRHHLNHFNVSSLGTLVRRQGLSVNRTVLHNAPLAAIDFPSSSRAEYHWQRSGVWASFVLGHLTGRTYLQTIIARR
jgi:SAM-dependent methyltransferase